MGLFQFGMFPYTDLQNLNLDWILQKIKSYGEAIEKIENELDGYVTEANKYTDNKFEEVLVVVDTKLSNFRQELQYDYNVFADSVNRQIDELETDFSALENNVDAKIESVNARTDAAIAQNNEYIFDRIDKGILNAKVINYFTGELVTSQEMFDYLAQFHLTSAIDYETLAGRNNTYDQLVALDITYTQLATDGGALIPQK